MSLAITNLSGEALQWRATPNLPWLTTNLASGNIKRGATQSVRVVIQPHGVAPGTYGAQISISAGSSAVSVLVTIVVQAADQIVALPRALTFSACGVPQNIVLQNTGQSPAEYTAAPSVSKALSLSSESGTIPAGSDVTVRVTVLCSASKPNSYTVNIESSAGSTVVNVSYGS